MTRAAPNPSPFDRHGHSLVQEHPCCDTVLWGADPRRSDGGKGIGVGGVGVGIGGYRTGWEGRKAGIYTSVFYEDWLKDRGKDVLISVYVLICMPPH